MNSTKTNPFLPFSYSLILLKVEGMIKPFDSLSLVRISPLPTWDSFDVHKIIIFLFFSSMVSCRICGAIVNDFQLKG
jgi:hypothetical protein